MGTPSHRVFTGIALIVLALLLIVLVGDYSNSLHFWVMLLAAVAGGGAAVAGAAWTLRLRKDALIHPHVQAGDARRRLVVVAPLVLVAVVLIRMLPELWRLGVAAAGMGILAGFFATIAALLRAENPGPRPRLRAEVGLAWREADGVQRATAVLGTIAVVIVALACLWLVLQGSR